MNINLGDASKFVAWGTNGMKNCLDHCKMILNNYGLTSYGSSATAIQLLKESDGKLVYASDNPEKTYWSAVDCIDRHLEAGRPIIVGVNYQLGNKYNEGTTDHFVVIYGREGYTYLAKLYDTNIYGKVWKQWNGGELRLDWVIAWQPLPAPYQKGE